MCEYASLCVYGGVWLGWCWYGRASKGKMAWIGQQQLWKAPKRLTDLVMAAVVTWAGMPFILNTVETARNVSANSCSAGQWVNKQLEGEAFQQPSETFCVCVCACVCVSVCVWRSIMGVMAPDSKHWCHITVERPVCQMTAGVPEKHIRLYYLHVSVLRTISRARWLQIYGAAMTHAALKAM